eukprot:gene18720-biopygen20470
MFSGGEGGVSPAVWGGSGNWQSVRLRLRPCLLGRAVRPTPTPTQLISSTVSPTRVGVRPGSESDPTIVVSVVPPTQPWLESDFPPRIQSDPQSSAVDPRPTSTQGVSPTLVRPGRIPTGSESDPIGIRRGWSPTPTKVGFRPKSESDRVGLCPTPTLLGNSTVRPTPTPTQLSNFQGPAVAGLSGAYNPLESHPNFIGTSSEPHPNLIGTSSHPQILMRMSCELHRNLIGTSSEPHPNMMMFGCGLDEVSMRFSCVSDKGRMRFRRGSDEISPCKPLQHLLSFPGGASGGEARGGEELVSPQVCRDWVGAKAMLRDTIVRKTTWL